MSTPIESKPHSGSDDLPSPREILRGDKLWEKALVIGMVATPPLMIVGGVAGGAYAIWHSEHQKSERSAAARHAAEQQAELILKNGTKLTFKTRVDFENSDVTKPLPGVSMRPIGTGNMSPTDFSHLTGPYSNDGYVQSVSKAKLGQPMHIEGIAPDLSGDGGNGHIPLVWGRSPIGIPIWGDLSLGGGTTTTTPSGTEDLGNYQVIPLYKAKNPKDAAHYFVEAVVNKPDTGTTVGSFVEDDGTMGLVVSSPEKTPTDLIVAIGLN